MMTLAPQHVEAAYISVDFLCVPERDHRYASHRRSLTSTRGSVYATTHGRQIAGAGV